MNTQTVDRCDFNIGESVAGKYVVSKVLGEGSFGKVYKVTQPNGNVCALKILRLWEVPPDIRQPLMDRFEMEFKTGQIDSPYLVRSLDYGTVGGNPYIVMEFCSGGDLTPYVGSNDPRIPIFCHQILLGLQALHQAGKVHRDLKPENILFKENGDAALTDFGIAGDRNRRMTQRNIFGKPNQIFGTYAYMPPEQANRARGDATVLPTTDIFSFGVLTYQLLTGQLPFGPLTNHNELANYQKHCKNGEWDRHRLSHLNDGKQWLPLIEGCLQPNFKERLQSVREVLRRLPEGSALPTPPQPIYAPQPHPAVGGLLLRVMQGEEYGRVYYLKQLLPTGRYMLTLGREEDNPICIREYNSSYISRHHCTLENAPGTDTWIVRDGWWNAAARQWESSSNGTYVDSTEATPSGCPLPVGSILSVGDVKIRVEQA
jgi:serine/threonine protein kinase